MLQSLRKTQYATQMIWKIDLTYAIFSEPLKKLSVEKVVYSTDNSYKLS